MGALSALGYRFLGKSGDILPPGGGSLRFLRRLDASCVINGLRDVEILIACDVENPMTGPAGAARIFGPQKGAGPGQVKVLEVGLTHLARVIRGFSGRPVLRMSRGGSAGGIAGSFQGLGLARLVSGFDLVAQTTGLERAVRRADLVLTGEGGLDRQSFSGKAVGCLVQMAARAGVPILALAPHVNLPPGLARRFPGFRPVRLGEQDRRVSLGGVEQAALKSCRIHSSSSDAQPKHHA
jgi:glycerate kinase